MAQFEKVLYTKLSNIAGISDLVGDRVYPMLPGIDEPTPFIVYGKVSKLPTNKMQQTSDLRHTRIQVDVYADDYDSALAVRDLVIPAMERWSDSGTNPIIADTFLENEIDLYEDQTKQVHIAIDFILHYYGI